MIQVEERKKMILAMEYIARQVNDGELFMSWLAVGVADEDIPYGSTNVDDVDDWYVEDENFKDIMSVFLRTMQNAWMDGGLYCGDVVSYDKQSWEARVHE